MRQRINFFLVIFLLIGGWLPLNLLRAEGENPCEIKNFLISPLSVSPGENLEISVEFTDRVIKATAIFGSREDDRCPLVSDKSGQLWSGRYELLPGVIPGQKKVKIFWIPDTKNKSSVRSRIYSFEVAAGSAAEISPGEQTREEKIGGYFIKKDPGETASENLVQLIDYYNHNLLYSPGNPQILRKLAGLYLKNREPVLAISTLEKVIEIQPAPYDFLELNRLYARIKDFNKGESFYKKLALVHPASALSGLGLLQLNFNKFWPARDLFKKVLKENPSDILALLGSARACWEMGWWADAEKFLITAQKLYPDNPGITFFAGIFWLARKDYRQAEDNLNKAATQGFPPGVLLYTALGESDEKQNQPEKAADFYRKVLTFEPDNTLALSRIGSK